MAQTWISDENGNRCSVEYWGSEEKAREALASNENCSDCSDCSDCSYCSRCSDCSRCSYCSRCSGKKGDADAPPAPEIPAIPDIHKRIYERVTQPNALDMESWHSCETTHCRAGWVVHEAGEAGYALEKFHDTALAAMLIYRASGYEINPSRFYDPADLALADMKRLAEQE